MQSCFSHFGINWDDARFVSLHGRPLASIDAQLHCPKLFVFTDPENTPNRIAEYLLERLGELQAGKKKMMVGECLGSDDERFIEGSPNEIHGASFRQPNCLIIVDQQFEEQAGALRFGLREDEITHSRGLITKNEVRAAVLHRLRLPYTGVFWDLGAGSGSISIESARLCPLLSIYAVEKQPEQLANILANVNRYRCSNVVIVPGEAPEVLNHLPSPDIVFIGGSGGRLEKILTFLSRSVKDTTRIVLTAVLEQTACQAPEILTKLNFQVEISLIRVSRYDYPEKNRVELNPIHLIHAEKNQ